MKSRKTKKGFTIIELVIVIGVIGILAAVLIPTFINLSNKANIASDQSLVKNLNTALKMVENDPDAKDEDTQEKLSGKNNTMQDAVLDLKYEGYYLENLLSKSGQDLLWDADKNEFILNDNAELKGANYWQIVSSLPDTQRFSYYASKNFDVSSLADLKYGFDVGYNTNIENLKYVGTGTAQDVVIRTDGGNLTIDAFTDTVKHFGYAEVIDVLKVAPSSLDEYGTVPFIKMTFGHLNVTSEGWVNSVHLMNKNDTSFDEIKVTVNNSEMPKFSREPINIQDGQEVKVCTVEVENKTEVIYLTQEGIFEQIKVAEVVNNVEGEKKFIEGAADSSKMNTIADQVSNNISGVVGTDYTINETTREVVIINPEAAVVTEGGVEVWEAQAASAFKGSGTQDDPFLVYDHATFQKISGLYDEGYNYFKVKDGITSIDCSSWTPVYLNGSFDGNGVTLKNVTAILFQNVGKKIGSGANTQDITVKNFTAELNIAPDPSNPYSTGAMIKNIGNTGKTTLKNITLHGVIDGYYNLGSFYNYGPSNIDDKYSSFTIELNNCHSDVTLICSTGNSVGGLLGHSYTNAQNPCTLTVTDCSYTGKAYLTGTAKLYAIGGYGGDSSTFYSCYASINGQTPGNHQNNELVGQYSYITKVLPIKGSSGYTVAKQTETGKIVVTLCAQFTSYDDQGNKIPSRSGITLVMRISEITNLSPETKVLDLFTNVQVHSEEGESGVVNGVLHIYAGAGYDKIDGNIRLQVNQYKSNGEYVSAGTIDLASKTGYDSAWVIA